MDGQNTVLTLMSLGICLKVQCNGQQSPLQAGDCSQIPSLHCMPILHLCDTSVGQTITFELLSFHLIDND